MKEVAVYEEDKDITAEFFLDEEAYPDARDRLDADVKIFNGKMPASKNIHRIRLREVPFEKTTTMKIKRYLLNAENKYKDNNVGKTEDKDVKIYNKREEKGNV